MRENEDDYSLIPSELDQARLMAMSPDGRVEAENRTWVCLRYPPNPKKGRDWCEFSLLVNCPNVPPHGGTYEFKSLNAMAGYLSQLESVRKTNR